MKKFLVLALALVMVLTSAIALADADITARGSATVTAEPDMVSVTANASVTAGTVAQAQAEMNKIIESVTTKLLELGVFEEDIVTQSYGYYPTYNYDGDVPVITGYQANHALRITCRDIEMLDSVIGVATDNGMSEIYNVSYDVSTGAELLYHQALELAIEAARSKAEIMAAAAGMTLTGLESLTENSSYYGVTEAVSVARTMDTGASGSGIRSGMVSISADVTAVYEAK